jgi:hypothetical protein
MTNLLVIFFALCAAFLRDLCGQKPFTAKQAMFAKKPKTISVGGDQLGIGL